MAGTHCVACERIEPWSAPWPRCESCSEPVCPDHVADGTLIEGDRERDERCYCVSCKRLQDGLEASANITDQWNLWHVAESVLSPTNQNLLNGDLVACFRDMAQELVLLRSPVDHGEPGR